MRYIGKVYISEVMDQTVVSGYVVDADPMTDPDHMPVEFTYQTTTPSDPEPLNWLTQSLYLALVHERSRLQAEG